MQFYKKVIILIKEKHVEMIWRNSNKKRYELLGYTFTKYGDSFWVKIEDLPKRSEVIITAVCEFGGEEKEMSFKDYNHITNDGSKPYKCRECFINEKILKYEDVKREVEKAGYVLVTEENEYVNGKTYIEYICPKHGKHKMKASNFYNGKRCPDCHKDVMRDTFSFSSEEVYQKIIELGGELLNKEDYINQDIKNLKILCPRCKEHIFTTSLKHFRQHGGQVCEDCRRKESIGERKIRQWLEKNNIEFIQEKWFSDCRDINPLPFDFYLPQKNILIEFDGKQHFEETHFFSFRRINNKFNTITSYTKYHDFIKTEYCNKNNIILLRIPYTEINNIDKILNEKIIA